MHVVRKGRGNGVGAVTGKGGEGKGFEKGPRNNVLMNVGFGGSCGSWERDGGKGLVQVIDKELLIRLARGK
jgi:hypothetical protein